MPHAIVLLLRPRQFVFADVAAEIGLAARGGDQTKLRVGPHHLPVQIKRRRRIRPQHAVGDEPREVLAALFINRRRIRVGVHRQIDLRFADVEEAKRVGGGDLARLRRGHYVVGQFAHLRGQRRPGAQRGKGLDEHHKSDATIRERRVRKHAESGGQTALAFGRPGTKLG